MILFPLESQHKLSLLLHCFLPIKAQEKCYKSWHQIFYKVLSDLTRGGLTMKVEYNQCV